jgi:hypothetical protein
MGKEHNFKVGDRVRVKTGLGGINRQGEIGKVIDDDYGETWPYLVELADGGRDCFKESHLERYAKTLDNLEVDDAIVGQGYEYTILAVCDRAVLLSDADDADIADTWYTTHELKEDGYTVKGADEEDVEELTVAEVEKRLGTRVKIIKED